MVGVGEVCWRGEERAGWETACVGGGWEEGCYGCELGCRQGCQGGQDSQDEV